MNNLLSFSSVKVDLFSKDNVRLKPASGFVVEVGKQYYLITNWHAVSGEQQELGMKPHVLKASVHIQGGEGEKPAHFSMSVRKRITMPLYDDNASPRWIEYRTNDDKQPPVDIVAFPIQVDLGLRLPGMNLDKGSWVEKTDDWRKLSAIPTSAIDTDVEYGPADTVHVIGYPHRWQPEGADRTSSAFWRTSFIASEIDQPGTRRTDTFFIDPCAPEGMTGSPVIGMKNDRMKLLGVYSDLSTAEFGASAGLVYTASLVKELIRSS